MFNLSTQTNLFLIVIAITTIINWICITIVFKSTGFISFTIYAVLSIPIYFLYIYNVNCLTYGNCELLSWIITTILSVSLIIVSIITIYLTAYSSDKEKANISFSSLFTKPIEIKEIKPTLYTVPSATLVPPATAATPATPATAQEEVIPTMEEIGKKGELLDNELLKPDLKSEERQAIWMQALQLFYFFNKNTLSDINRNIAFKKDSNGQDLSPEVIQDLPKMKLVYEIFIQQHDNMRINNLFPQLEPDEEIHFKFLKLHIQFLRQQKQFIDNELLKQELQTDKREELYRQLLIVTEYIIRFEKSLQFYIIHQIEKPNLKSEQRQLLWQQLLELIVQRYIIAKVKIQQEALKPELEAINKQKLQNLIIIFQRFIEKHDNMRIQKQLPQLEPGQYPRIELESLITRQIVQQKEFIAQELLKPELQTTQKEALQQQLILLSIYSNNVLNIGDIL